MYYCLTIRSVLSLHLPQRIQIAERIVRRLRLGRLLRLRGFHLVRGHYATCKKTRLQTVDSMGLGYTSTRTFVQDVVAVLQNQVHGQLQRCDVAQGALALRTDAVPHVDGICKRLYDSLSIPTQHCHWPQIDSLISAGRSKRVDSSVAKASASRPDRSAPEIQLRITGPSCCCGSSFSCCRIAVITLSATARILAGALKQSSHRFVNYMWFERNDWRTYFFGQLFVCTIVS